MNDSKSGVQSVDRAIAILKSFSLETPERGVSELSRKLGLHKSTVSRLARSLANGGLLSQDAQTGRYRLGVEVLALASRVTLHANIREIAGPLLRDLAYETQETVSLSVDDAGGIVAVEQFAPPNYQIKNVVHVGRRMDMHASAGGKVFLAYMTAEHLERHLRSPLVRYTPNTVIDGDKLKGLLPGVRAHGYATAVQEWESGLNAISAPIFDRSGQVIAVASISGPFYRLTPEVFPSLAVRLKRATAEVSRRLGCKVLVN